MGRANAEAFRRFSARRGGSKGPFLVLTLQQFFFGRCRLTLLSLMRPGSRAPKRPDTEFSVEREIVLQLPTITRLTAALAAAFVLAGSASAFTISDIRVEGLTRRSPVRSFRIFLSAPV